MFSIEVCMNTFRRITVALYRFNSSAEAIEGRIAILTEWKRKNRFGIVVGSVRPPK